MVINQDKSMENERLMKIIVEKENIIREGSKVERLYMHKVKNQILLGKGSFGEVVSAEYNNEKVAIKKMENGEDAIVEMAIMLKTTNNTDLERDGGIQETQFHHGHQAEVS